MKKKQKRAMNKKNAIRKRRKQRKLNKKYESLVEKEKSLDMIIQLMEVFKNMGLDPETLSGMGDMEAPSLDGSGEEDISPEDMEQFKTLLTALMGGDLPEGLFDFEEDSTDTEEESTDTEEESTDTEEESTEG